MEIITEKNIEMKENEREKDEIIYLFNNK